MSQFKDKILLITGGTGSFGNAVLNRFLHTDKFKEIRIFSRDEKKQDDMRHRIQNPKVKFYIGDVRDKRSVDTAMRGVDYVFHAAALKQVPSCEFFPMQAVRTNVYGTENVLDSAVEHGVKNVVVKAPAATLTVLAEALKELYRSENEVRVIGTRHGEKLYETLVTREEMFKAEDMGDYFRIPADSRDLNYDKYFVEGEEDISSVEDYHSHNTRRLDVEGMKELLLKLEMIREDIG